MSTSLRAKFGKSLLQRATATRAPKGQTAVVNYTQQSKS